MRPTGVVDDGKADGANDDLPAVAPEQDPVDPQRPGAASPDAAGITGAAGIAGAAPAIDATAGIAAVPAMDAGPAIQALTQTLFDWRSYAALYPDLRDSGFPNPSRDLRDHFAVYGQHEGRAPSILFDIGYVRHRLAKYEATDVPAPQVFAHFALLPPERRFVPNRWFSPWAVRRLYAERYPEIETMSDYALFEFYLDRRAFAALSPCGTFSEERYRRSHPDVAAAVGEGHFSCALVHYITCGAAERRGGLPGATADTEQDEVDWLLGGQAGIEPRVWWFDETFYLSVYPDVHDLVRRGVIKSGLEHYMIEGFPERRLPSPHMLHHLPPPDAADPWAFYDTLSRRPPPRRKLIPIEDACAILRLLDKPGWAGDRRTATDTLWGYVQPGVIDAAFDAAQYMAVNVDVAASLGTPQAAEDHWRDYGLKEERVAPGTNFFARRGIGFQDMLLWRSGVNFFGPVSAASGLGTAARGYISALRAAGIAVDVYDTSRLVRDSLPLDLVCADDLAYSINFLCLNADQVMAFTRIYGTAIFDHRANVGAWVWELPSPRIEWRGVLSAFDLIITPSRSCTQSFALTTDTPVRTVPYVVDAEALQRTAAEAGPNPWLDEIEAAKAAGRRVVLFIMDASSYSARKGVDLYRTLAERLDERHPGRFLFVLKSHSRDVSLTRAEDHGEAVLHIDSVFSAADLHRLKTMADLYISTHRSEGFGLNIVESVLLGVPALCPAGSGCADLLADGVPALVPVTPREIGRDMGPYKAEAIWYEPDLDAMEATVLAFFEEGIDRERFEAMQRRLATDLSAASIGARLKRELTAACGLGAERSRNRLEAFRSLALAKHDECLRFGYVTEATRRTESAPGIERLGEIAMMAVRPSFSVITPTRNSDPQWLYDLYDDLLHQSYPAWEWCIADDGSTRAETLEALRDLRRRDSRIKIHFRERRGGIAAATNAAVGIATAGHIVMVDHDDRISPDLLAAYYEAARGEDGDLVLYCDEDKIDPDGRHCQTYHKPDWSPEHLMACMYILHCLCVRKKTYLRLGGYRSGFDGAQDHDFLLRASSARIPVRHVDQLLYHWRISPESAAGTATAKSAAPEAGRRAVAEHLARIGIEGTVEHASIPGSYRVRPRLPAATVALNILTGCERRGGGAETAADGAPDGTAHGPDARGGGRDWPATYVSSFVRSILAQPPAPAFTIRVVVDEDTLALAAPLAELDTRVEIVPFRRGGASFNFAEKANFAVRTSGTDRVVLLNDDMEAIDGGWLAALLEPLELPGVGIVGGQMLRPDDTIQHCGIALGIHGAAAHLFEGLPSHHVAYNAFNQVMRNYAAVSGAMIAFRRAAFDRVGGFDERFPIDFNDVDFCLRLADAGLRTVYTPFARLRHFESRSARRLTQDALDRHRFCTRWASWVRRDPFYNRHLTRSGVMCEPASAP